MQSDFCYPVVGYVIRCSDNIKKIGQVQVKTNSNNKVKINLKKKILTKPWSQSYQTLISLFFRFLFLSLSVCSIRKYSLYFEMANLNSKKRKTSSFYGEKSLVGLNPRGYPQMTSQNWKKLVPKFITR
jgi:hypothetical protein